MEEAIFLIAAPVQLIKSRLKKLEKDGNNWSEYISSSSSNDLIG